ncbi:hypothetical protein BC941DRAFT_186207 [Chlamydoabsidia padenii]|nr:hypothetical protein BC941DRAFT_186207 [Chlamydoabsidia padenii]
MHVLGSEVKISKVSNVYNTKSDGKCGFRCVAMAVFGDEKKYMDVKTKMLEKLREIKGDYEKSTWINKEDSFGKLEALLMNIGNCLHNRDFWFTDPVCSQLAADTFETPIKFHGPNHSTLYLPLTNHKYKSYRPIALNLHADHIYLVTMKKGTNYGYAPINMMHNSICEKLDLNNLSASIGQ